MDRAVTCTNSSGVDFTVLVERVGRLETKAVLEVNDVPFTNVPQVSLSSSSFAEASLQNTTMKVDNQSLRIDMIFQVVPKKSRVSPGEVTVEISQPGSYLTMVPMDTSAIQFAFELTHRPFGVACPESVPFQGQ